MNRIRHEITHRELKRNFKQLSHLYELRQTLQNDINFSINQDDWDTLIDLIEKKKLTTTKSKTRIHNKKLRQLGIAIQFNVDLTNVNTRGKVITTSTSEDMDTV